MSSKITGELLEAQRGALGSHKGRLTTDDLLQLLGGQLLQRLQLELEGAGLERVLVLLHDWTSGLGTEAITVLDGDTLSGIRMRATAADRARVSMRSFWS